MRLNPIYRKIIIPWYDSDLSCILTLIILLIVFLFGLIGIGVSYESPDYSDFIWMAVLLSILSGFGVISVGYRLLTRYLAGRMDAK